MTDLINVRFSDGAVVPVPVPAFTVATCITEKTEARITIVCRMKTPADESGFAALEQAVTEHPNFTWKRRSGVYCGAIPTGAPNKYYVTRVKREGPNSFAFDAPTNDPMLNAFKGRPGQDPIFVQGTSDPVLAGLKPAPKPTELSAT
jgi:hypothetical protein